LKVSSLNAKLWPDAAALNEEAPLATSRELDGNLFRAFSKAAVAILGPKKGAALFSIPDGPRISYAAGRAFWASLEPFDDGVLGALVSA
jgi:hypothetical protein